MTDETLNENWLPCIEWSGEGSDLPTGATGMPGIYAWKLVRRVIVLDAESDEGTREVKVSDYDPATMDIMDVLINDKSYKAALKQHRNGFTFIGANGSKYTREQWRTKFGTDALHLMAIRELTKGMHKGKNQPFVITG